MALLMPVPVKPHDRTETLEEYQQRRAAVISDRQIIEELHDMVRKLEKEGFFEKMWRALHDV